MPYKKRYLDDILDNKSFIFLLIGHCFSNFADIFQSISATMLLINMTGSGLAAGFGLLCAPAISIFLFPVTIGLVDRVHGKYWLIFFDILKGLVSVTLIKSNSVWMIYFLLLVVSCINIIYSPIDKKLFKNIVSKKNIIVGNSLLSGVSGISYLFAPILAGTAIRYWNIDVIFLISSIFYAFSSFMILNVKYSYSNIKYYKYKDVFTVMRKNIREGLQYYKFMPCIKEIIIANAVYSFGAASVNLSFYTLAFDAMKISSDIWGIMLSVFYGTNLIAMFFSILFKDKINKFIKAVIYSILLFICLTWLCYGIVDSWFILIIALVIEGVLSSIFNILLITRLQLLSKGSMIARIICINDIISSISKLIGIFVTFLMVIYISYRFSFIVSAAILFIFIMYRVLLD